MVEGKEKKYLGELVAETAVGGDSIFRFYFGAEAVDELVDGMVGDTGAVFDVRIDGGTDLVFGDDSVLAFQQ